MKPYPEAVKVEQGPRFLSLRVYDTLRDAKVIQDRATGEQISVPNKFILSIGINSAFELMRPDLFQEYRQQN